MSAPGAIPADGGAQEIRRLLTARNPALERAQERLAKALPRGLWMESRPKLRLVVDPAVVEALKQLRNVYRGLWARIDAIDTDRHVAKRQVLEGIELLNASFTLLLRSTETTSYSAGLWSIREAKARQARASAELNQAVKELA